jgi:nitrogen regulatory protein PII
MKSVFIVFNQAMIERVEYIFDLLEIKGYTWWQDVQGRGSVNGEPRRGSHTWPEMNSAAMVIIPDDKVETLLAKIKIVDEQNKEVGIRAFVWSIEQTY